MVRKWSRSIKEFCVSPEWLHFRSCSRCCLCKGENRVMSSVQTSGACCGITFSPVSKSHAISTIRPKIPDTHFPPRKFSCGNNVSEHPKQRLMSEYKKPGRQEEDGDFKPSLQTDNNLRREQLTLQQFSSSLSDTVQHSTYCFQTKV